MRIDAISKVLADTYLPAIREQLTVPTLLSQIEEQRTPEQQAERRARWERSALIRLAGIVYHASVYVNEQTGRWPTPDEQHAMALAMIYYEHNEVDET